MGVGCVGTLLKTVLKIVYFLKVDLNNFSIQQIFKCILCTKYGIYGSNKMVIFPDLTKRTFCRQTLNTHKNCVVIPRYP